VSLNGVSLYKWVPVSMPARLTSLPFFTAVITSPLRTKASIIKRVTMGGGGSKNIQYCVTSFVDDPLGHKVQGLNIPVVFRMPWRLLLCLQGRWFHRKMTPGNSYPVHTKWHHWRKLKTRKFILIRNMKGNKWKIWNRYANYEVKVIVIFS
jgi:hypothetical protein